MLTATMVTRYHSLTMQKINTSNATKMT